MKHRVKGKKLNRSLGHRRALYKNLAVSLIEHGQIKTTLGKARAARPFVERLVTYAKEGDLASRRRIAQRLSNKVATKKLFGTIAPQFAKRAGGYTRIVKLGPRDGDQAEMARLEFVEVDVAPAATVKKKPKKKPKVKESKKKVIKSKAQSPNAKPARNANA